MFVYFSLLAQGLSLYTRLPQVKIVLVCSMLYMEIWRWLLAWTPFFLFFCFCPLPLSFFPTTPSPASSFSLLSRSPFFLYLSVLLVVITEKRDFSMYARLASNFLSSCLSLWSAGITGRHHHCLFLCSSLRIYGALNLMILWPDLQH